MSSSIFFKFKSQKEPSQITFDGTSLSVFEVKRDIIAYNKLGDGTDFDLEIYSIDTNEAYDDDTMQIPRSTTVVARRLPALKPGAGRAARYVSGKMPVTAKNQHRVEKMNPTNGTATTSAPATQPQTEEEKLQAMFSENKASWQEAQAEIAAKGVNNKPFFSKTTAAPDKPVPDGYICHRCGQKGHWIQACPTNNDPLFDGRPKFRRTTGIPRSFLQKVEKPEAVDDDGKIDVSKLPPGVMYTPEGDWVVSRPDEASWQKFQDQNKSTAEQQKAKEEELTEIRDRGLACPLSNALFEDPVRTPCCDTAYSRAAIENELMEKDFVCPNCGKQVLLDDLKEDKETAEKVTAYKEERDTRRTEEAIKAAGSAANSPQSTTSDSAKKAPSPTPSKKRAAEDELENDRKPDAPVKTDSTVNSSSDAAAAQNMQMPNNDFMNQMFASMAGAQGMMPGFNNMMMNPMLMNQMMGMNMMPNMGMNMMPNMGMMQNGMGQNGMMNGGNFNGGAPTGPRNWQGQNNGGDGAYFRQPVNPGRRGRQNRPRSMDYKQV